MSRKFKIALLTVAYVNMALAVLNFCTLLVEYDRILLLQGIVHTLIAAYLRQWVSYDVKISEMNRKDSDRLTAQNQEMKEFDKICDQDGKWIGTVLVDGVAYKAHKPDLYFEGCNICELCDLIHQCVESLREGGDMPHQCWLMVKDDMCFRKTDGQYEKEENGRR